jgi:hypothetical protein
MYKIEFAHFPNEGGSGKFQENGNTLKYVGHTTCVILKGEELISTGKAFCGEKDKYNKEKGRKVALSRAIKNLDRDTRTTIWNEYFCRK